MTDAQRHAAIVGNGPTGSTVALMLARRGWRVTLVDRDTSAPVPAGDGADAVDVETWQRPGVPQFHQPHIFNNRLLDEMRRAVPDVLDDVLAAGDVLRDLPGGLQAACCRRSTLELAMRRAVAAQPGIDLVADSATGFEVADGRVTGLRLRSGSVLDAELVVDAGGRRSRLTREHVDEDVDESTNTVYANRRFRLRPGQGYPAPVNRGTLGAAESDAYSAVVFPHDGGTFTIGFNFMPEDDDLGHVRHLPVYEAAVAQVPMLEPWLDPDIADPISDVMVMSGLRNTYRTLRPDTPLGLQAVGDVVCTTNPVFGRGTTLSFLSALTLADAVLEHPDDPEAWRAAVDAWQREELWPWFEVALEMDRARAGRWRAGLAGAPAGGPPGGGPGGPPGGGPGGPGGGPLPRYLFMAAGSADPEIGRAVQRHMNMVDPPQALMEQSPRLAALLASGWRPGAGQAPLAPPRARIVEVVRAAAAGTSQMAPA